MINKLKTVSKIQIFITVAKEKNTKKKLFIRVTKF